MSFVVCSGFTLNPVDGYADAGGSIQVTATGIAAGYSVSDWLLNGVSQGASDNPHTFPTITGPSTVTAVFTCSGSSILVGTSPDSGQTYTADGDGPRTGDKSYCWTAASSRTLATTINQDIGDAQYRFVNWADGLGWSSGLLSPSYTVPGADTTVRAYFTKWHALTVTPPSGGSLTYAPVLPGDTYYPAGQVVTVTAVPNANYVLAGWSGTAASGATLNGNDITFTMDAAKTLTVTFVQPLRVDKDSVAGSPDGLTWATAYPTLQAALADATPGQEIWVADGTYKPGALTTDRFNLISGVAVYGGFGGISGGETSRSQRNWKNNVTILSGDLNNDDTANWGNRADNVVTVVYAGSVSDVVLDGFTISGGYHTAAATWDVGGAGIHCSSALNITIANCVIKDNRTSLAYGGGIYFYATAASPGSATVENCLIVRNYAGYGGGICVMPLNEVLDDNHPVLVLNSTIANNEATQRGGGTYCQYEDAANHFIIKNSIVWGNTLGAGASEVHSQAGLTTITYSDAPHTSGTTTDGGGNLNYPSGVNPSYADAASDNWRLQSGSPCIGFAQAAAAPAADLDGRARPQGVGVDMGAYEYAPPLTVTINVAGAQPDPTSSTPVNFTVVFSEAVTDFVTGDVTLSGSAGATTAVVTGSGTTYNVAVSGMTVTGTVIASIDAGKANSAAIVANSASTSTDNSVDYTYAVPLPDQTLIQFK